MTIIQMPLERKCDFCGTSELKTKYLFAGRNEDAHICIDCVLAICQYIKDILEPKEGGDD